MTSIVIPWLALDNKAIGLDDLIIGARQADPSGQSHAGKSYVVL
jgi:hypothetical protein